MTREEVENKLKESKSECIILSLPTSFGKSRLAIEKCYIGGPLLPKVLVVYPKVNLKKGWIAEYNKWGYERHLPEVTFTTYNSLGKHADKHWDAVIFDEGHHISERVLDIIKLMSSDLTLILSATVSYEFVYKMRSVFRRVESIVVKPKEAIDEGVLPDPQIILWPLTLNMLDKTETIVKNPKATKESVVDFSVRGRCTNKNVKYLIKCTEHQYLLDIDNLIEFYKRKAMGGNQVMKNMWLHKAGERLKWLALKKTSYVYKLLTKLANERTLTFCGTIAQTEYFGSNCIHSKNKNSSVVLDKFNNKEINHITSVAMLDEGANLVDCRIGIFANINSSDRLQTQRVGRILRHENPLIIIPYFKNTREEEIVRDMIVGYNPDKITIIESINDLKI